MQGSLAGGALGRGVRSPAPSYRRSKAGGRIDLGLEPEHDILIHRGRQCGAGLQERRLGLETAAGPETSWISVTHDALP